MSRQVRYFYCWIPSSSNLLSICMKIDANAVTIAHGIDWQAPAVRCFANEDEWTSELLLLTKSTGREAHEGRTPPFGRSPAHETHENGR